MLRSFFSNQRKFLALAVLLLAMLTACGQKAEPKTEPEPAKQKAETGSEVKTDESTEEVISKSFVPVQVKDITEIKRMKAWLEYFYYNNLFDKELNNETGEISPDAMLSFAASYIMQMESQGLRFDTDTFRLYIPKKQMEEVVLRFFDKKIEAHHSLSQHEILFEEDNYVIKADLREWPTRLDILSVTETAPKVYSAVLNGNNTEVGQIDHQVKAEFQLVSDRYVLKKYQMITDPAAFVSGNPIDVGNPPEDESTVEDSGKYEESGEQQGSSDKTPAPSEGQPEQPANPAQ